MRVNNRSAQMNRAVGNITGAGTGAGSADRTMTDRKLLAGVIGWPIAHSLSPTLHNYWLRLLGRDQSCRYESRAVAIGDVNNFFMQLAEGRVGWVGCNVTLPHKLAALAACQNLTTAATAIGAVNTITVVAGELHGDNSDAYGFIKNMESWPAFITAGHERAVVLGAGGAARAIVYGLRQLRFTTIVVVSRRPQDLKDWHDRWGVVLSDWSSLPDHLVDANIVINTTPLGLKGESLPFDLSLLPSTVLVHDIIYGQEPTPLLVACAAQGLAVRDGLDMLIHQAVVGFKQWFGVTCDPPIDDNLRRHLLSQKNILVQKNEG